MPVVLKSGRVGLSATLLLSVRTGRFFGRVGVDVGGRDLALQESNLVSCWRILSQCTSLGVQMAGVAGRLPAIFLG